MPNPSPLSLCDKKPLRLNVFVRLNCVCATSIQSVQQHLLFSDTFLQSVSAQSKNAKKVCC